MTLPNFLVIGAAKAGTTSLYEYLRQHPDVFVSPVKEPHYYWEEGRAQRRAAVTTRAAYEHLFVGARGERAVGEASTQYLQSPTAAERIAADLPDVKLIVSLRNPADRAYSSYLGRMRGGEERRDADAAMRAGTHYFETSLYAPQLARYFARFPRHRIKVILFEDLAADARAVMRDLFDFLGVDPSFEPDVVTRHNTAAVPRWPRLNALFWKLTAAAQRVVPARGLGIPERLQRPLLRRPAPLPPAIRARMLDEFRDDIAATAELIGRDLSLWLQ